MNERIIVLYGDYLAVYKNGRLNGATRVNVEWVRAMLEFIGIPPIEIEPYDGIEFPPKNAHDMDWRLTIEFDFMQEVPVTFLTKQ